MGVDLEHAAALTVNYLTEYHMLLTMADVKKGQIVLVYAAARPPEENLVKLLQNHFGKSVGMRAFVIYTIAKVRPDRFSQSYKALFFISERRIHQTPYPGTDSLGGGCPCAPGA
jgi:hypothetical protein